MKRLSIMLAGTAAAALTLTGCSDQVYDNDDPDGDTVVGVAATPGDSPAAVSPVGTVTGGSPVQGVARAGAGKSGAPVALLGDGSLTVGPLSAVADGSARRVDVPADCDRISSAVDGVTLACGDKVLLLDATGKTTRTVDTGGTLTSAVAAPDGSVAVTKEGTDKVTWYGSDGAETGSESVTATGSDALLVGNDRNDDHDGVQWRGVVVDAGQSSVTDIDISGHQRQAGLRVGQGVGTVSAGYLPDGVFVASDPRQDQALVYTMTDLVRHTQAVPTGPGPWATLWDADRQIMWVSTTGDNTLTGYRLSSGTPVSVGSVRTVAAVRHLVDDGSGDLLVVGADGSRELIDDKDLPA
ncbi:hypothetical protein [Corynebacterium nuruki]|uniref:hypothetical protein n=1 Tax=Corynebacterium nuruki TaxID=1032851 RepID=UPI0002485DC8|nr:hypothetical protein [Corynebacterium nuruki]